VIILAAGKIWRLLLLVGDDRRMTTPTARSLEPAQRRRLVTLALLRARDDRGARCFVLRAAAGSPHAVAAGGASARGGAALGGEALAVTAPLFLLLFASACYVMARSVPGSFGHALTRTDSLYFTVTTFSTVGFGDITAVSEAARLVVTAQMILDLLVLGLCIRVFVGAVHLGVQRAHQDTADPGDSPGQPQQQPG
jgi:hypothetical protein